MCVWQHILFYFYPNESLYQQCFILAGVSVIQINLYGCIRREQRFFYCLSIVSPKSCPKNRSKTFHALNYFPKNALKFFYFLISKCRVLGALFIASLDRNLKPENFYSVPTLHRMLLHRMLIIPQITIIITPKAHCTEKWNSVYEYTENSLQSGIHIGFPRLIRRGQAFWCAALAWCIEKKYARRNLAHQKMHRGVSWRNQAWAQPIPIILPLRAFTVWFHHWWFQYEGYNNMVPLFFCQKITFFRHFRRLNL